MVERHVLLAVFVCVAVAGTLALAAWISREVPTRVPIDELDGVDVGTLVTVEGSLEDVRCHGPKVYVLTLSDGTGEAVDAFCSFACEGLVPGTRLRVTGRVSLYRGQLEVVVGDREDLVPLGGTRSPPVDVDDLVREPWLYDGMEPLVRVTVLAGPVADSNGEEWWCLVGEPSGGGAGVLALMRPGSGSGTWSSGDELDLRVVVRYDGTSGFVYLEVLDAV